MQSTMHKIIMALSIVETSQRAEISAVGRGKESVSEGWLAKYLVGV